MQQYIDFPMGISVVKFKAWQFKGIYSCPIEVISGITNKAQFQYLNGFKGPKGGDYLYETKFLLDKYQYFIRKYL